MATYGERIAELRKQRGVTQKEIAELLGVGVRTAQHYEYMEREPSIAQFQTLADFFNVSLDYLTGRSEDPTPPERSNDQPEMAPEDIAFYAWVKEHVTGMHFYDLHKAQENQEWLKGLRIIYEKEKGRRPGQKQGE